MMIEKMLVRHKTTKEFIITDSSGVPVNLAGKTVKLILNNNKTPDNPILSVDCTITEPAEGKCEVTLTSEQTDIPADRYYAQLDIIDAQQEAEATVFNNDFHAQFIFVESLT